MAKLKMLCALITKFLLTILCIFSLINNTSAACNTWSAIGEVKINRLTVKNLGLRWTFFAGKDISATLAIADEVVYFPSGNGFPYALNAVDGSLIWKQSLSQLTGLNGTGITVNTTVSRSTSIIADDLLIVEIYGPVVVVAVSQS
ncbi:hypothetical protein K2173_006362 [Erythroxylum novogranatense]|uniref:Uncharacterized protein n=1 Tax=Erythroxylum novogranatense TaxID=1862640 RepID=A0AAV8U353_9ROSI|nr:hypothetical protein K2173_006362 [Erythroxylum novogranatense]